MVSVKERTNLHTAHILFSHLIHLLHWSKVHVYEIFCQEKDIPPWWTEGIYFWKDVQSLSSGQCSSKLAILLFLPSDDCLDDNQQDLAGLIWIAVDGIS